MYARSTGKCTRRALQEDDAGLDWTGLNRSTGRTQQNGTFYVIFIYFFTDEYLFQIFILNKSNFHFLNKGLFGEKVKLGRKS